MNQLSAWLRAHPAVRQALMPAILLRRAFLPKNRRAVLASMMERVVSGSVILDLPDFAGSFELSIHSHLAQRVMLEGAYEPEYAKVCAASVDPERDAIDIGANVGFYSVLMAKCVAGGRKVLSLEPTPSTYERLRRNLQGNGVAAKVISKQVIAANKDGPQTINVYVGQEEYSSVGDVANLTAPQAKRERLELPGRTIDSLCAEHGLEPGFIKIDVEGFEYQVLLGCPETLRKARPTILIEINPPHLEACGASVQLVFDWLRQFGYELADAANASNAPGAYFEGYVLATHKASDLEAR